MGEPEAAHQQISYLMLIGKNSTSMSGLFGWLKAGQGQEAFSKHLRWTVALLQEL